MRGGLEWVSVKLEGMMFSRTGRNGDYRGCRRGIWAGSSLAADAAGVFGWVGGSQEGFSRHGGSQDVFSRW